MQLRKCIIRTIAATLIAVLLTAFLTNDLNTSSVTAIFCGSTDVEVSDFYNRIRAGGSEKILSDDIIIVNIDSVFDRAELAQLLNEVNSATPKAVAVDVLFDTEKDEYGDLLLIEALEAQPGTILAARYNDSDNLPATDFISTWLPAAPRGMANLTSLRGDDMIREFTPFFGTDNQYPALSTALLQQLKPAQYAKLLKRHGDELIRFQPEEFFIASPAEVLEKPQILKDKTVFIGTITDASDVHQTPLGNKYPGVMIHAQILAMMLKADYIKPYSAWINYLLALISCITLAFLYLYLNRTQNLVLRILPIIWILAIGYLGCLLFDSYGIYIDAPRSMLLSALALMVLDVWCAADPLIERIFKRFKTQKQR